MVASTAPDFATAVPTRAKPESRQGCWEGFAARLFVLLRDDLGERDREGRAFAVGTVVINRAAVALDDRLGDRQSQARPGHIARACGCAAEEALEEARLFRGRDPATCVCHAQ